MKLHIAGSTGTILCQTQAVRAGFATLGHQHVDDPLDPDVAFVFVGNPPFEDYFEIAQQKKTIFNVLDLARHCPEHPQIVSRFKEQLPKAARVTAISKTVAKQLENLCGIKAEVVYYPMKPVAWTGKRKYPAYRALLAGRLNDPNKRTDAAIRALIRAGFTEDEVAIVGPEYPGWGSYCGVVSDEVLNDLYSSVDYVLMLSREEGIGLPAIEAACCGAIPIVAPNLSTFDEFWVNSPLGLHYHSLTDSGQVAKLIGSLERNQEWKTEVRQDIRAYALHAFVPKFNREAVAKRIIETFQTI